VCKVRDFIKPNAPNMQHIGYTSTFCDQEFCVLLMVVPTEPENKNIFVYNIYIDIINVIFLLISLLFNLLWQNTVMAFRTLLQRNIYLSRLNDHVVT